MDKTFEIEDESLNESLREHFLSNENEAMDEMIAGIVLSGNYDVTIDKKKEEELLRRLSKGGGKKGYCLLYTIGIFAFIFFAFVYIHSWYKENKKVVLEKKKKESVYVEPGDKPIVHKEEGKGELIVKSRVPVNSPLNKFYLPAPSLPETLASGIIAEPPITKSEPAAWKPPVISDEQARQTESLKLAMIKYVLDQEKRIYTKLKSGRVYYKGGSAKQAAFTIRNFEVTNIEYKVFLNDLILKGRYDDFRTADVNTELWNKYNISGYSEKYFEDPEYGYFPVVNISAKGAELFCEWLQEEVNLYAGSLGSKKKKITIRLPYDLEWVYYYDYGYVFVQACDGYNSVLDKDDGLVLDDHPDDPDRYGEEPVEINGQQYTREELQKKFLNKNDLAEKDLKEVYNMGLNKIQSSFATQRILDPELMSVACNYGDVPEMIYEKKSGNIILIGQCWKDRADYSKMHREFNSHSGLPYIGFRPIVILE